MAGEIPAQSRGEEIELRFEQPGNDVLARAVRLRIAQLKHMKADVPDYLAFFAAPSASKTLLVEPEKRALVLHDLQEAVSTYAQVVGLVSLMSEVGVLPPGFVFNRWDRVAEDYDKEVGLHAKLLVQSEIVRADLTSGAD